VLVAGGEASATSSIDTAELYDPATGTWSPAGTMASARERHVQELLADGKVLVAGGFYPDSTIHFVAGAELYDPSSNSWTATGSLTTARTQMASVRLGDGTVLAAGGVNSGGYVRSAERYDPDTGSWSPAGSVAQDSNVYMGAALPDGRALLINAGGAFTNAALFAPAGSTPTPVADMSAVRGLPTMTTLADGRVLVAGGGVGVLPVTTAELYTPLATRTVADADFGSLGAGGTAERDVTVTNSGGVALWVDSVALGGADASAFAIATDGCGGHAADRADATQGLHQPAQARHVQEPDALHPLGHRHARRQGHRAPLPAQAHDHHRPARQARRHLHLAGDDQDQAQPHGPDHAQVPDVRPAPLTS
jgi:hypothetical protein